MRKAPQLSCAPAVGRGSNAYTPCQSGDLPKGRDTIVSENIATRPSGTCIQSSQQDNVRMNCNSCNIAVLSY